MRVDLGVQWEGFINESVKNGHYLSADDVIRDGLRMLQEKEQLRQRKLCELRDEVDKGLEELDHGSYIEMDEADLNKYLEDVKARGRRLLSEKK